MNHQDSWTKDKHAEFLKKCEQYIGELKKENKLIAAQPLIREGKIIFGSKKEFRETSLDNNNNTNNTIQVGYYHIFATDINEASLIARRNPEFEFSDTAKVEVRQIKTKEKETGFEYPNSA